jgi:hypothetical protein
MTASSSMGDSAIAQPICNVCRGPCRMVNVHFVTEAGAGANAHAHVGDELLSSAIFQEPSCLTTVLTFLFKPDMASEPVLTSVNDCTQHALALQQLWTGYSEMCKLATSCRRSCESIRIAIPVPSWLCHACIDASKQQALCWRALSSAATVGGEWMRAAWDALRPVRSQLAEMPLLLVPIVATHGLGLEPLNGDPQDTWNPSWIRCLGRPLHLRLRRLRRRILDEERGTSAHSGEVEIEGDASVIAGHPVIVPQILSGLVLPHRLLVESLDFYFVVAGGFHDQFASKAGYGWIDVGARHEATGDAYSVSLLCLVHGYHPQRITVASHVWCTVSRLDLASIPQAPPGHISIIPAAFESWDAVWRGAGLG